MRIARGLQRESFCSEPGAFRFIGRSSCTTGSHLKEKQHEKVFYRHDL